MWQRDPPESAATVPLAEAAAAVQPESAARCNVAGRVCRRTAEHTRAEQWYDRGIGLAKRSGSAKDYIDAQLGLGALLHSLGAYQAARKHYLRGARRAQRFGRRRIAGETYHELMGLAAEVGPTQSVVEYARLALANYRVNEPLLPTLAHDYSFALVRGEHFSVALPLLEIVVPLLVRPGDRLIGLSTLTRAVAGAGDPSRFDALSAEVRAQVRDGMEYAAAALINLAEGAALLQRPNQAESLAGEAARIAHARKDAAAERIAFALVERIRNGRARPEVTLPPGSQLAAVATEFLLRLRRWRGPDVPRQAGRRESGPPH